MASTASVQTSPQQGGIKHKAPEPVDSAPVDWPLPWKTQDEAAKALSPIPVEALSTSEAEEAAAWQSILAAVCITEAAAYHPCRCRYSYSLCGMASLVV